MSEHQKKNKARKRKPELLQISDAIDWNRLRVPLEGIWIIRATGVEGRTAIQ